MAPSTLQGAWSPRLHKAKGQSTAEALARQLRFLRVHVVRRELLLELELLLLLELQLLALAQLVELLLLPKLLRVNLLMTETGGRGKSFLVIRRCLLPAERRNGACRWCDAGASRGIGSLRALGAGCPPPPPKMVLSGAAKGLLILLQNLSCFASSFVGLWAFGAFDLPLPPLWPGSDLEARWIFACFLGSSSCCERNEREENESGGQAKDRVSSEGGRADVVSASQVRGSAGG